MRRRATARPPRPERRAASRLGRLACAGAALLLVCLAAGACGGRAGEPSDAARRSGASTGAWARYLASDSAFGRLHARLSEPGGYFDTDNLISNEASYLHVIRELERSGTRGGAYLGVGPDQNFSYIAALRPSIAFIVDVRRDNVLQHLMLKALLEASESRLEYLCLLVGRACGAAAGDGGGAVGGRGAQDGPAAAGDGRRAGERTVEELIDVVDAAASGGRAAERARRIVLERVGGYGIPLSEEDLARIERFHGAFTSRGLDLRFSSHGRRPRFYYPTLRQLLLERDREGRRRSYVASEEAFRVVKSLSDRNLIVPVVGDLAGPRAVARIAGLLEERGETVSAFYVSNVEFYLWRQGRMEAYFANLDRLPTEPGSLIIRSYFGSGFRAPHPDRVPGYASTQLVEPLGPLLEAHRSGRVGSYRDLVTGERGRAVGEASSGR